MAALILGVVGVTLAPSAQAAPPDSETRARVLYAQGEQLANSANWAEACPLFQAAHDLHPTGGTALRCADCYEKIAKYERALEFYQFIVDHRDVDRSPDRVMLAERRVEALRRQLGLDKPAVPPPQPPGPQPPGPQPPPPQPPGPPPPLGPRADPHVPVTVQVPNRVPGIVLTSVGGLGVLIGAITGGVALSKVSSVKGECTQNTPCTNPSGASDKTSANTFATVADIGLFAGGAVAVTGIVLLAVGVPKTEVVTSAFGPSGIKLHF